MRTGGAQKVLNAWVPFARPHPNGLHIAGEREVLQPPTGGSIWYRSAAQPHSWVQGRSALPGELFINSIVGQYCVSFGWGH